MRNKIQSFPGWLIVMAALVLISGASAATKVRQQTYGGIVKYKGADFDVTYAGSSALKAPPFGMVAHDPNLNIGMVDLNRGNQVLNLEWAEIIVTPVRVFVRKTRDEKFLSYVPIERSGKAWKAGKPVLTPYTKVSWSLLNGEPGRAFKNPVWLGVREPAADQTHRVDVLDDNGVTFTTLERLVGNKVNEGVTCCRNIRSLRTSATNTAISCSALWTGVGISSGLQSPM